MLRSRTGTRVKGGISSLSVGELDRRLVTKERKLEMLLVLLSDRVRSGVVQADDSGSGVAVSSGEDGLVGLGDELLEVFGEKSSLMVRRFGPAKASASKTLVARGDSRQALRRSRVSFFSSLSLATAFRTLRMLALSWLPSLLTPDRWAFLQMLRSCSISRR